MKAKPIDLSTVTAAQRKRFYEKIDRSGDGCWLWTGGTFPERYGSFTIGLQLARTKRCVPAHRLAWMLAHPRQPLGPYDLVLHKCDVRACCRISHLFIGDHLANARDMVKKGRSHHPRGEIHPAAILTEQDVRAIRSADELLTVLAERYGVCFSMISSIKRGKAWKHIEGGNANWRKNYPRGEKHHNAKLNMTNVRNIRISDESAAVLARRYAVAAHTIRAIRNRKAWKHVE